MKTPLIGAIAGALFGIGLSLSGMADPTRVLGFLTLGPGWDPTLAFVMGAALTVAAPGLWWAGCRPRALNGAAMPARTQAPINRRLLIGAGLFGLGWGLAGYCPGPALVAGAWGASSALALLVGLLIGGWVAGRISRR